MVFNCENKKPHNGSDGDHRNLSSRAQIRSIGDPSSDSAARSLDRALKRGRPGIDPGSQAARQSQELPNEQSKNPAGSTSATITDLTAKVENTPFPIQPDAETVDGNDCLKLCYVEAVRQDIIHQHQEIIVEHHLSPQRIMQLALECCAVQTDELGNTSFVLNQNARQRIKERGIDAVEFESLLNIFSRHLNSRDPEGNPTWVFEQNRLSRLLAAHPEPIAVANSQTLIPQLYEPEPQPKPEYHLLPPYLRELPPISTQTLEMAKSRLFQLLKIGSNPDSAVTLLKSFGLTSAQRALLASSWTTNIIDPTVLPDTSNVRSSNMLSHDQTLVLVYHLIPNFAEELSQQGLTWDILTLAHWNQSNVFFSATSSQYEKYPTATHSVKDFLSPLIALLFVMADASSAHGSNGISWSDFDVLLTAASQSPDLAAEIVSKAYSSLFENHKGFVILDGPLHHQLTRHVTVLPEYDARLIAGYDRNTSSQGIRVPNQGKMALTSGVGMQRWSNSCATMPASYKVFRAPRYHVDQLAQTTNTPLSLPYPTQPDPTTGQAVNSQRRYHSFLPDVLSILQRIDEEIRTTGRTPFSALILDHLKTPLGELFMDQQH